MYKKNRYQTFTSKEIKPEGWLKRQLEIQADGLSGNLYKIWPDVSDSCWIGGSRKGWERVPYWLDGFIPLAYLLNDREKQEIAKKYIDGIIAGQQEDGWICQCEMSERNTYDVWSAFLICKVLVVYYECSGDERVEGIVYKILKNLRTHLRTATLHGWGSARWYECLIPIYWLYERVKEDWLLALAVSLYAEGINYKLLFENWYDQEPRDEWNYETHVVNIAMALKEEIMISKCVENVDTEFPKKMLALLDKYHGTAVGHFTGDECLSGNSPIQGTELCGVVEAMYSYEIMFAVTGEWYWLDRLEMLAFNALPAAISEDMWTHQYDQLVNQIACVKFTDKKIFRTNSEDAHLFGLEPNYGCCTANFNQGWPKLALSTYLRSETGIISAVFVPASLHTEIQGVPVIIKLETEYPFKGKLNYFIETTSPVDFAFEIRIPKWAKRVTVNGKEVPCESSIKIEKTWEGKESLDVEMEFDTHFNERNNELFTLQRGPLIFSLPIEEEWKMYEYEKDGVERKFPYCDYEVYPKSKWNYAFVGEEMRVIEESINTVPFSKKEPSVEIEVSMVEIPWNMKDGYEYLCNETPEQEKIEEMYENGVNAQEVVKMKLRPYGCTTLRMTEMPKLW